MTEFVRKEATRAEAMIARLRVALDAHLVYEGVEVEVRGPGGSWLDVLDFLDGASPYRGGEPDPELVRSITEQAAALRDQGESE